MKTIKLIFEYDGTDYSGWQIQPNGRSVQEVAEDALARILGCHHRLFSSGRTDAGVHAKGMAAHFTTDRNLPMSAYREGMNRLLPRDVAVREACEASADFHARFSARGKLYRYTIFCSPVRSPLLERFAWHLRPPLDLEAMGEAAAYFPGEHDFAAFRTSGCAARTTVRRIDSVKLRREGELLLVDVSGSGFLKNMVRVMVGTLVEVGRVKRAVGDIPLLLQEGRRPLAGATAPPQGLCLMEVRY